MRTICIFNHKGGVGKTTTAINLAAGLSRENKKVLLVDLDPQGNVDTCLKIKKEHTLYDAMTGKQPVQQCIANLAENLDILSSTEEIVKAEHYLAQQENSRLLLKEMMSGVNGYDFMIFDCPPSLGLMNQNALAFCKEVFVPVATDYLGFDALKKMQGIVTAVNRIYGNNIKITKIIPTMYDRRNKICKETLSIIQNEYPERTTYPIHMNSKIKEAPKFGKSIFSYAKSSSGARDYGKLVEDVLAM